MGARSTIGLILCIGALGAAGIAGPGARERRSPGDPPPLPAADPASTGLRPAPFFERNAGQADPGVQVVGRGGGITALLAGPSLHLVGRGGTVLPMVLVGADPGRRWEPEGPTPGRSHYLLGNDPAGWLRGIPQFRTAVLRRAWPGVDAILRGDGGRLAYGFRLEPGAAAEPLRFALPGAGEVAVDGAGDLVVDAGRGVFRHSRPVAWQEGPEGRRAVPARFRVEEGRRVRIDLGARAPSLPTFVDPRIEFSTYVGGSGADRAYDSGVFDYPIAYCHLLAADAQGHLYLTGETTSVNFPVKGAYQGSSAGNQDLFVVKLDPAGQQVVYATYIGSSSSESVRGIAVDPSGRAVLTGDPPSGSGFPITTGCFQPVAGDLNDVFVLKLAADGSNLVFSTFLGGGNTDRCGAVACDAAGNVLVTGTTASGSGSSASFPVLAPIQGALAGVFDAFVTKLKADGSALLYSTYYGGSGDEFGAGIAVGGDGSAYVTGYTSSTNLTLVSPAQATPGGGRDAFLLKLTPAGDAIAYATYLGGALDDAAVDVAVDGSGQAFLGGRTKSADFPVTAGVFQSVYGGVIDGFVARFSASGARAWATYLGGSQEDRVFEIELGQAGTVCVSGETRSTNFPTSTPFQAALASGQDGFVTKLAATGATLTYSSYLGSPSHDYLRGMAALSPTRFAVAGWTDSTAWPVVAPVQSTLAGSQDMVVAIVTGTPRAPQELTATPILSSRVDLVWIDMSADEAGFEVWRKAGAGEFVKISQLPAGLTLYSDGFVVGNMTFTYRVRAFNLDDVSAFSEDALATTPPGPPGAPIPPTGLEAAALSPRSVGLSWIDASDSEDFFQVSRKAGSGAFSTVATPGAGVGTYLDGGVLPDRTYTYGVRAGNVGGLSAASNEATVTLPATLFPAVVKGTARDVEAVGRDTLEVSGSLVLGEGALASSIDPPAEEFQVLLDGWDGGSILSIPAGDPGWRERRGRWTWKSPKGSPVRAQVKFDPAAGAFAVKWTRFTFPRPMGPDLPFAFRYGDEGGRTATLWTPRKGGRWKLP